MLAQCFRRDFRKVVLLACVVAAATAMAITSFALAATNLKPVKTACMAKTAKLQILRDTDAPLFR